MHPLKLIGVARAMAALSKDPSTKVGALIVDDEGDIVSPGFNGFPRGVVDSEERYNDRPTKYLFTVHAELNAIVQAARKGVAVRGCNLIVTALHPCNVCAGAVVNAGIKCVYAPLANSNDRWGQQSIVAATMFQEAGVPVLFYDDEGQLVMPTPAPAYLVR